ncbi:MAG: hypothetical protein VKI42_04730 [Synechococcaceae cyanobacterium]|nr:hypothetical protein [Synechococcaceae cyanobacterium]
MSHHHAPARSHDLVALAADGRRPTPQAPHYRVPELLRAVEVLNLLEITGSQRITSQTLGLHQSSVSRILQGLRQQLQLVPGSCERLRYGDAPSLWHLRQAVRAHRIHGGWLQLVADPLHHSLLRPGPGLLPGPAAWLGLERLAGLVHHAVLDGALVSSLAWAPAATPAADPALGPPLGGDGVRWFELVELPLWLVAPVPTARGVLVPPARLAPGLHGELGFRGLAAQVWGTSGQTARAWLRRARSQGLALPLCLALLPPGWLARQGSCLLPDQDPLPQRLWLLQGADLPSDVRDRCLRLLRRRCAAFAGRYPGLSPGS